MRKRENRTVWCTYTIVSVGMLAALQLLLSRILSIPVGGFGRVSLSPVATMMAGIWLGPSAGGLTGLVADLLGCLIQGYAVNPIITCSAVLWGVIPAVLCPAPGRGRTRKVMTLIGSVVCAAIVCSVLLTTMGLVLINGFHFYAIITARLTQFSITVPVYCLLVCLLYFSPVTQMVRSALHVKPSRQRVRR